MNETQRYCASISYDGSGYHGWQIQPNVTNIAAHISKSLSQITNQAVLATASGRTDAGVHALNQIIHFDCRPIDSNTLLRGCNAVLPNDICINWIVAIDANFHARFSAIHRRYAYLIWHAPVPNALWQQHTLWRRQALDIATMQTLANALLGSQDWAAMRSSSCQSHISVRNIHYINIIKQDNWLAVDIQADAFLHNMIRILIGMLLAVGCATLTIDRALTIFKTGIRDQRIPTIAANGLYFLQTGYPSSWRLPAQTITGLPLQLQ